MRRDLHETLSRLVDNTVQSAGRAPDSSGWLRKGVRDGVHGGSSEAATTFPRGTSSDARFVSTDDDSAQDDARKQDEKSSVGETEKPSASRTADTNQVQHLSSSACLRRAGGLMKYLPLDCRLSQRAHPPEL